MNARHLFLPLILSASAVLADEVIDRSGAWDVNGPLGAHSQLQGLGAHWELWAIAQGGMNNHDALRVATLNGAEYLGMDEHLGSIEEGKLADFIVPDKNPLDEIQNSDSVRLTIIIGVVYNAASMDQLWPRQIELESFIFSRPNSA